ncbi:alpha-hydroxy-acid oxidizing protein [Marinobacterium sedimentorum]|uniref:alpha-hydroxy-acid oxidizing protein n=1 Tax=Marinobacterium sedimentorum TaxID=2927804 RepID=UPI0020C70118|nr:alpha-hydroxy-acid oxidizing protein [Marinobacterium sedimentorum]MCP8688702.1 alpha-hydroxy-acid oxidizing protein [Marinobacterium sedimentorum]
MSKQKPIKIEDYRELARKRLPRMVFDYLDGGADDEHSLKHNRDALDSIRFKPKRLVDVSSRSLETTLFGHRLPAPLAVAPTGLNGIFWPNGDLALARAAAKFKIPFILSTASNASIEEVAQCCDGEKWFQLYVVHRKLAQQLVERARHAGYTTLILTTDVAINGLRERDLRNDFGLPVRYTPRVMLDGCLHPRWSIDLLRHGVPQLANFKSADAQDTEVQAALLSRQMDASFDWDALKWLRELWPHTLIVKGIIDPADAQRCVELGADGVILSNHGGRQLDTCLAPIECLEDTVRMIDKPVLIDSGFRRGSDVVKAIAMGAQGVLLGRALLYALAARGEAGVEHALELITSEIDRTLANLGSRSITELNRSFVQSPF